MSLNCLRKLLILVIIMAEGPSCFTAARNIERQSVVIFEATHDFQDFPAKRKSDPRQASFGAEEPVQQIASLPSMVLEILRGDERNKSCLSTTGTQAYISASWFVASSVKLRRNRDSDLLVTSNNSCLNGANVAPFWIFRKQRARYDLILKATGLVLDLLDTRTNHYRDIRLTSLSANREYISLYKFNGNSYAKSSSVAKRPRSKKKF
jgi:hypothetical protein